MNPERCSRNRIIGATYDAESSLIGAPVILQVLLELIIFWPEFLPNLVAFSEISF